MRKDLSQAHLRLSSVNIEHMAWDDCVKRYDRPHSFFLSFFYLDRPYWLTEGYTVDFEWLHYEKMAELMQNCEGKFLLSINDHSDIKSLFKGFTIKTVGIKYTVGSSKSSTKKSNELLIMNY